MTRLLTKRPQFPRRLVVQRSLAMSYKQGNDPNESTATFGHVTFALRTVPPNPVGDTPVGQPD